MNQFKQALDTAGLRPVEFINLVETLSGYRPPASTVSRWIHQDDNQPRDHGAYDYALALVKSMKKTEE